ncbi:MAG: glycosyltransferase family 9 protein [Chitinivibrionales bacterium]
MLFGDPTWKKEHELYAPLLHIPGVILVEGQHLRKVCALLHYCALFIGNDTALMHITAAVDTSVLGIFGPTSPSSYLPITPGTPSDRRQNLPVS